MAIGDTDVSICNKALRFLGANTITSFQKRPQQPTLVIHCKRLLKHRPLQCTLGLSHFGKQTLAQETTSPVSEWSYQYALPNDMVSGVPRAVRASTTAGSPLIKNFEIGQSSNGGTVLFSDETTITIDYQKMLMRVLCRHIL